MLSFDQVGDAPVAPRSDFGNGGIAIEPEERHGGREHAGALVLGLVEHLARGRGDDRMNLRRFPRAEMIGRHHPLERGGERPLRIGKEGRDAREGLLLLGVEDMENRADEQ
jgi:hypothetical protein